ncbi:MAG: FAD:protein FMN transferase [Candidatus Eisenbacteria bacterium]
MAAPMREVVRARVLMGTVCTLSTPARDTLRAGESLAAALDEVARLETVMSDWSPTSEVARVNALAASRATGCSQDLFAVLDSALALARLTAGAFDPTVEPLVQLWDMRGEGRLPDPVSVARVRPLVDHKQVTLDAGSRTVRLGREGMGFNLGGIGKGFALERAATLLRTRGIRSARLELGGQLFAMGAPCTVGVAHPGDRLRAVVRVVVRDASVSTSSQGEHRIRVGHASFGHVLDPHQGISVMSDASVTVVCASPTRADALSTALLVMGRDLAEAFTRTQPGIGVLWLEPDGASVRAWRWNLPQTSVAPGAAVQWLDAP